MSKNQDRFNVSAVAEADEISCSIRSLTLPCRDGVRIHTLVYFPPDMRKKRPVLLLRSPYYPKNLLER
ncbi:MAG: hypothetical protein J5806_05090, partial [Lentisphaeria bacterium]|nr:hypothetical protein [Lentisphaeria bacterium]